MTVIFLRKTPSAPTRRPSFRELARKIPNYDHVSSLFLAGYYSFGFSFFNVVVLLCCVFGGMQRTKVLQESIPHKVWFAWNLVDTNTYGSWLLSQALSPDSRTPKGFEENRKPLGSFEVFWAPANRLTAFSFFIGQIHDACKGPAFKPKITIADV